MFRSAWGKGEHVPQGRFSVVQGYAPSFSYYWNGTMNMPVRRFLSTGSFQHLFPYYPVPSYHPIANVPVSSGWSIQGEYKENPAVLAFQNPLQPMKNLHLEKGSVMSPLQNFYPSSLYPYPQHSFVPRPPTGLQTILNSFKNQDGSLDIKKMIDTTGQVIHAVNQVSSMVKGLGGIFKI